MSSERGNVWRTRPQRHQNARAFQNDKYDTSAQRKVGRAGWGHGRDTSWRQEPPRCRRRSAWGRSGGKVSCRKCG
ncbi:hypothetical protein Nmel_008591 [Mimus melanotis]